MSEEQLENRFFYVACAAGLLGALIISTVFSGDSHVAWLVSASVGILLGIVAAFVLDQSRRKALELAASPTAMHLKAQLKKSQLQIYLAVSSQFTLSSEDNLESEKARGVSDQRRAMELVA